MSRSHRPQVGRRLKTFVLAEVPLKRRLAAANLEIAREIRAGGGPLDTVMVAAKLRRAAEHPTDRQYTISLDAWEGEKAKWNGRKVMR